MVRISIYDKSELFSYINMLISASIYFPFFLLFSLFSSNHKHAIWDHLQRHYPLQDWMLQKLGRKGSLQVGVHCMYSLLSAHSHAADMVRDVVMLMAEKNCVPSWDQISIKPRFAKRTMIVEAAHTAFDVPLSIKWMLPTETTTIWFPQSHRLHPIPPSSPAI